MDPDIKPERHIRRADKALEKSKFPQIENQELNQSLLETSRNLDEVRQELRSLLSENNIDEKNYFEGGNKDSLSEPQRLMKLYLEGKITQGELAFRLKSFNNIVADTMIRQSRHSPTTPVDYAELPKSAHQFMGKDIDEPMPGQAKNPDINGRRSNALTPMHEDDSQRDSNDRHHQQDEQQQQDDARQVLEAQLMQQNDQEVSKSHQWREIHRQQELEEEGLSSVSNSLVEDEDRKKSYKG